MVGWKRAVAVAGSLTLTLAMAGGLVSGASAARSGGSTTSGSTCHKNCTTTTDTTAPSIAIASPASGATVSGTISVSGTASDNVSLAKVEVSVDGGAWALAAGTSSWSAPVDTTTLAGGSHTITARATDSSANVRTASVTVSVANGSTDTVAPTVAISTPAAGSSVSGTITVAGTAGDNVAVASVSVSVDGGAWQAATGTSSWSASIGTLADGSHSVTAKAADAAGNSSTTAVTFSSAGASNGADVIITDPSATHPLAPLGRGKMAEKGSVTALLYWEQFTSRRAVYFRDAASGATSVVDLPVDSTAGWTNANYVWTPANDLWVLGGDGPVSLRKYHLTGSTLPTAATLVSDRQLGTTDSRVGDLTMLASGGLVVVWHEQGSTGPQGLDVGYVSPSGTWQALAPLSFMPTNSSKQVVAQHPADGSIWVFNDPDAWSAAGAVHLTEQASGLQVDWTDGTFLSTTKFGDLAPDRENPDLAAAVDTTTGTIALAFQNDHRKTFSTSPFVTGSYVSVARIQASGAVTFTVLPVYVERISALGLVVRGGDTSVAYRPVDPNTLTYDSLELSTYHNGAWSTPVVAGSVNSSSNRINYGISRFEAAARMADGNTHLVTAP